MSRTRMTTLPLLLLALSPLLYCVRSVSLRPFGIFYESWQKCRTGPDDVSRTRMTTLPFLLLALSPFVIFDNDYPLILCPLCKSDLLEYFYDTW